jgi:ketosteroid isomerase-like protein
MSARKELVERYCEGFRRGDHAMVLGCLIEDVVWDLPGHTTLTGKEAFDREIGNPAFTGRPTLAVDRLVEEGDTVVAIGAGRVGRAGGGVHHFAFCDAFTFAGDLIRRVESYVVALPAGET